MNDFKENFELGAANTTYFFISQFNFHETTACHHWEALACFTTSEIWKKIPHKGNLPWQGIFSSFQVGKPDLPLQGEIWQKSLIKAVCLYN